MKTFSLKNLLMLTLMVLAFASCKKEKDLPLNSNAKVFSTEKFKQNIVDAIGETNAGYCFAISHNGLFVDSFTKGYARVPAEGNIRHSIYKRMNIASVTKWLTAVAAQKMLSVEGISLQDKIKPYLPPTWDLGPGVDSITFHQLLRHRAGLTTADIRYATDYAGLKACMKAGVVNNAKNYNYSNVNFALFRIMMPFIDNAFDAGIHAVNDDEVDFDNYLAEHYLDLMQKYLFTPAGVSNASCMAESRSTVTLMYSTPDASALGRDPGDWKLTCGGGGYFLSAYEMVKIMTYVYHSEDILTKAQVQTMEDNFYGHDGGDSPETSHGRAYGKGGALWNNNNADTIVSAGDRGLETLMMKFPAGVEIAFFSNHFGNGWTFYSTILAPAYENAWIEQKK